MRFEHWLNVFHLRLRSLFRRDLVEQEMDEEMRYHLERQIEDAVAKGASPEEARYAALRAFGGMEQHREAARDTRHVRPIEDLLQDLFYGFRILRRNPSFTAVVLLTLALGIGANTSVFTLVNTVLLRPLPYEEPERLVRLWARNEKQDARLTVSPAEYLDIRNRSRTFEEVAALFPAGGGTLTGAGDPERLNGARVSSSFFRVLGVAPIVGRSFTSDEDRPGTERTILLSHGLWQRRFSSDSGIVGKAIVLSGISYRIIGVMPEEFTTPAILAIGRDVWLPLGLDPGLSRPSSRYLRLYGKLRPDVALSQVQTEMNAFANQRGAADPENAGGVGIEVVPLHEEMVGQVRPALIVIAAAAALLLLIACSNVASLLLGRAVERRRELAVRLAMGAGRGRLVRQLLAEVSLLFIFGGVLGFLFTYATHDVLIAFVAGLLPRGGEIRIDTSVFFFALSISFGTALLFGLAPALKSSRLELNLVMKQNGEGDLRRRGRYGLRSGLVISQLALSCLLLVGAGLLIDTFLELTRVDPGFNPDSVLNTRISLPAGSYPQGQGISNFNQRLIERIYNLPGVRSAAVIDWLPFSDTGGVTSSFTVDERKLPAEFRVISAGYFETMEVPLKGGRRFASSDTAQTPQVFVVNEEAARRYWPGLSPIGARITIQGDTPVAGVVVGIVGNTKHYTLYEEPFPYVYAPHTQAPWMNWETRELLVKTEGDPLALAPSIRAEIRALEKNVPVTALQSVDEVLSSAWARPSFYAKLTGVFAALALALASIGIYGVVSYWVRQRKREIGIRMAIGAQRVDAVGLLLRQAAVLIGLGVAFGLAAAFGLTRFLSRLEFFRVSPTDPVVFAGASVFLVVVALVASYLPARRATRTDALTVLRHE
jgi:putative ABC transport system permease protein